MMPHALCGTHIDPVLMIGQDGFGSLKAASARCPSGGVFAAGLGGLEPSTRLYTENVLLNTGFGDRAEPTQQF